MSVQNDSLGLEEDGLIELGDSIEGLCFHQALNVFLVTTKDSKIRVYDPHSSLKLSDVQLHGDGKKNVFCVYHGESNSVVVCGGRTVGMRRDHHGVLLLDTVLQAPVAAPEETVLVEMLLSEGIQLQQTLGLSELSNIDHASEVREVLAHGIAAHQSQSRINPKLAKWSTLRLELPLGVLRSVCVGLVSELKRLTKYTPALSIASALIHRLAHLLPPPTPDTGQGPPGNSAPDRDAMFSEAARLATFIKWPHMNYKWALPEQMAQAGFFHQPIAPDDDRAMCFICSVCLVYWEPTDEPWSEHERHSPNCPFVKGEYTHNVPLSVTHATSPALIHSERAEEVAYISHTNSHQFIASATRHGSIVVWNTVKELKKEVSFSIDPSDSTILDKHFSDTIGYTDVPLQPPVPREAWVWGEDEQNGSVGTEDNVDLPGPCSETDAQVTVTADTDAVVQSPVPSSPTLPPTSPPSPPAPVSQVVELPLDDIAVDELFAPPRPSHDVRVSSLCVLADPNEVSQRYKGAAIALTSSARSSLVVGVGLRRYELFGASSGDRQETCDVGLVQVLNNVNQASQREAESLDIMKLDSSRRGSTEEDIESDCVAVPSKSASLSESAIVSTSVSSGQQNFVPYLLVYDLNVKVSQSTTSNKVATKSINQGPYKKSTVKVGTFGDATIIPHPKAKLLWSNPLANDLFFTPPNLFVKSKGTSQVGTTCIPKSKAKDNVVSTTTSEPDSKNDILKKEPKCIQCIPLPHKLNSVKLHLTVDQIVPTPCGEYIVVTLSTSDGLLNCGNSSGSAPTDSGSDGAVGGVREVYGAVIVYRVYRGGEVVSLQEEPLNTRLLTSWELVTKKLLMLPPEYGDSSKDLGGVAACITMDGSLALLSLSTLEFFCHVAAPAGRSFNNVVYCNSLERLCVSCDDGRVSLVQLRREAEVGKELQSAESVALNVASTPFSSVPTLAREPELQPGELLVNQPLSEEVLDKCVELTAFQTGCPKFVATVPPCWSEIIQAQKQRRNPQHLQQHAEDIDTTRTWRLESDSSTWDEHLFELLLPAGAGGTGGVQVGHIDLKLSFIPGPPNPLPTLQVTLLRQNLTTPRRQNAPQGNDSTSSSACCSSTSHNHVSSSSSSNIPDDILEDLPENPVVTKEFLLSHNAEILCGPVNVNRCFDLSGQGANVTLTSPSLLACRSRTYLVHIKALPPKVSQQQQQSQQELQKNSDLDLVTQYMPPQSSTFLDRLAASSNKRVELVRGCDVVQELSITVRCCAKTTIVHDRLQRLSLVENEAFHKRLLEAVINKNTSDHMRHRALDLLLWITSIHTAAVDDRTVNIGIITLLQLHLSGLVHACLLQGDRSVAHKTSKIIVTALEGSRVVEGGTVFGWAVLEALLEWLDSVLECQSAGALHWFFTLLNHVKWCNPWGTARKVTQLLSLTSESLSRKVDPLHAVLQTRFNLYGTPFERELFDIEPPLLAKYTMNGSSTRHSNSAHSNSNNTNNNNNNNITFGGSGIPGSMQGGPGTGVQSSSNLNSKSAGQGSPYSFIGRDDNDIGGLLGRGLQVGTSLGLMHTSALCGLLEVEPLHFTLHMASDGTKMERASSGTGHPGSPFMMQPFTLPSGIESATFNQGETFSSSGTAHIPPTSLSMLRKAAEDMAIKNQAVELLLAKKATKTYQEKLQTLREQLASMKYCLQKAKQRTHTLTKVVASENSLPLTVNTLLPYDGEKANEVKDETSTISSSSSDATPDHEGLNSCVLPDSDDMMHSSVQYMGNGDVEADIASKMSVVGSDVTTKIKFGLSSSSDKEETDSLKESQQQKSHTKRKSEEDVSSLESKASTPSNGHTANKEGGKKVPPVVQGSMGTPWQQLLSLPPQQMLVIERMHSGARRFVVLDFGAPVLLTDVVIPACSDLVSLSIDIWMTGEETDGERLVVASDIGMRPLILADLQPPPLCRYLKVTTLGRYGMNTSSQCRIPVGAFYGHTLILPWQMQPSQPQLGVVNKITAQTQLTVLGSVVEDIGCRYSLACSKLRSLLNPLLMSPTAPSGPSSASSGHAEMPSVGVRDADLERRIIQAYQECMLEQQHLNLVVSVMRRLQRFGGMSGENVMNSYSLKTNLNSDSKQQFLAAAKSASDKLAILMQYLLNCLLTLSLPIPSMSVPHNLMEWCGPEQAKVLVEQVCLRGPKGAQVGVASLLARLCAGQQWWGDFLANTMITLFSSSNTLHFPATRVFALLTFLGQKSVGSGRGSQVINAILRVLSSQLHGTASPMSGNQVPPAADAEYMWQPWQNVNSQVDTHLVSWLLLYLSLCLDALIPTRKSDSDKGKENGGRWTWLTAETCLQRRGSEASRTVPRPSRERLRKRLVHQKQPPVNLETATKSFGEVGVGQVLAGLSGEIYQKLDTFRRNIVKRYTRASSTSGSSGVRKEDNESTIDAFLPLDRSNALSVAHGLIKLLMNSSSPCCVDSFLLTCKVIGGLVSVTRPSPALTEIVTPVQLGALLRHALTLDSTWGAPWALHALTCLLQDILEGERLYGSVVTNTDQQREEAENMELPTTSGLSSNVTATSSSNGSSVSAGCSGIAKQSGITISSSSSSSTGTTVMSSVAGPLPTSSSGSQNGLTPETNGPRSTSGPVCINGTAELYGPGTAPLASGSASEAESGEGEGTTPSLGACVITQNCPVDQSATPLSPPVVSMATPHYTTLEEEDLPGNSHNHVPGKYSFLDLEDSSESEDMIGEYLADIPTSFGGPANNNLPTYELAMSNLTPPYPPPPLLAQTSNRVGKDSRIGDLVNSPLTISHPGIDHSTAVDARLEAGVSLLSELRLHMMAAVHTSRLSLAITAPLKVNNNIWGDNEICGPGDLTGSIELLTDVFQKILLHLSMQFDGSHLECVLGLWLGINLELAGGKYTPSVSPTIPLTPRAIAALLAAVVRSGSVSMRCWCLVLQTLTLCCNHTSLSESTPPPSSSVAEQYDEVDLCGMAIYVVTDANFVPALQKLLTGSCASVSDMRSDVVGSTVTGLLEDLLVRLRVRCDVISVTSGPGSTLKQALLSLVSRLLEPQGAISLAMGPLDAQCCLLSTLLSMHYDGLERMHIPLSIISSTVVLVHSHLVSNEGVTYGATNQTSTMLGGLFASVLGSDGRQGPTPSRLALLCSLLNLSRKLAQTGLINPAQVRVGIANYEAQENSGGSLTDSSKLEQQRSDTNSSQTDEHKAMHTPQTCSHAAPNSIPCLADTVLQNSETMQFLLKSLVACEGNSVSLLLGAVSGEVSEKFGLGETLTDALYQLLLMLNAKATTPNLILTPIVSFITPGGWWSPPLLSEPSLCFLNRVLDCPTVLKKFADLGGMKMLWENLVSSVGMMGGGRGGLVTAVMNHLAPPLPVSTHNTSSNKRSEPVDQTEGLYNFAPLAVVTSSNPTARPANVLVDSNQLFQRTKSAPWSYHFYPDESWVDLILTLPCAVLLHEVHLLPHTVSLVSCPSAVSVEVGVEGGYLMPVSGPLSTAGLSRVRLVLPRPVVASIVVVRLHRPRDSATLGLSQLKLLGTTTFREALRGLHENSVSDHTPHRASMWWLRLIHQCMFHVEGGRNIGAEAGASVNGVMEACITLLLTPPGTIHLASSGSDPLEDTTLALARRSPHLLHTLIMTLLTHPLLRLPSGGNSLDAAIALLYELCVGSSSMEGVSVLLSWLHHVVMQPLPSSSPTSSNYSLGTQQHPQQMSPQSPAGSLNGSVSAEILHCIAAVLWNTTHDTTSHITDELFRHVYEWSERSEGELKIGLDHIMCSMCHVRPQLFTQLLINMSVLTVIDNNQSITDDRKDREAEIRAARTDDMKEGVEGSSGAVEERLILQDPSVISLTPAHLQTLATVAQSPQAIHLMLDSGFPLLLVHGILEWCKTEVLHQVESCTSSGASESATDLEKASVAEKTKSAGDALSSATPQTPPQIAAAIVPTLSTSLVAHTLHTLAALCAEPPMRDWLGSVEGSVFWLPLLTVLGDPLVRGSEPLMRGSGPSSSSDSDYSSVEDATIHLMRQCCHNHPHNQNLLASTLCHLIQRQNIPPPGGVSYLHSLSGFTRRLVLQLLLEGERVVVHINSPQGGLASPMGCSLPPLTQHPKFGAGHKTRLLNLPTTTTIMEIIKMVTDWSRGVVNASANDLDLGSVDHREAAEISHAELIDKLSAAAAAQAKERRHNRDKVNGTLQGRLSKKVTEQEAEKQLNKLTATTGSSTSSYALVHDSLGNSSGLPTTLTVAQVMAALRHEGHTPASHVTFTLTNRRDHNREGETGREALLLCTEPLPSTLHVFTSQGGLSLLAQHMSLLYPDTGQQHPASNGCVRSSNGDKGEMVVENDWVSLEMNDYESANVFDYLVMGGGSSGSPGPVGGSTVSLLTLPSIPPHALGAFTLFLRLPGYAETLLKDTHKACCLLRLALGVTDDGDGGDIVGSGVGGSLATMPFQVLESLLEATPLTTDDGLLLRRMCLESGALHLILACLAALSHQDTPEVVSSLYHQNVPIGLVVATTRATCVDTRDTIGVHRGEGDRCHYWAKGTGYGTGSTTQSWDVEQALVRQKVEEEHVVWLVRLLAQYINPGDILPPELQQTNGSASGDTPDSQNEGPSSSSVGGNPLLPPLSPPHNTSPALPPALLHLFQNSGLITTIASNLSNDSVLDMSRHVPLYRALLALVRGLSVTSSLSPLLMTTQNSTVSNGVGNTTTLPCIPTLLEKMKSTVNTYMAKLRWKSSKAGNGNNSNTNGSNDDVEQEEGLSLIVPDIQKTAEVVKICTERLQQEMDKEDQADGGGVSQPVSSQSLMEVYLIHLKPLQFDTFEMVVEDPERGIKFVVSHHYEGLVRGAGDLCIPRRMKRLAQEAVTLSSSLPLSYSSSVFVRTDLDRLDIMKVLITGPEDTPYANGCFEFDVYFPVDYPTSPLHINLQTTGEGRVRFNPNLYQDGKVCLSILNTWHGRPEEKWNPQTSSLLQVLVSIQSLIFVSEPYFNEPGYERSRGTPAAMQNSREYDANIRAATVRWAMLNQLRSPSPCFKEVIERHFWLKHKEIMEQVEGWITDMESLSENRRAGKTIAHNTVGLKKSFQLLKDEFRKMSPPPGLEGFHLASSLLNACSSRATLTKPHTTLTSEKEREEQHTEVENELKGATGGQAGGPVRTRTRKTSRANLFMSKPHSDAKHLNHNSAIPATKSIASTSATSSSPSLKSVQQGILNQDSEDEISIGVASSPLGDKDIVSVIPDIVQTTCFTSENDKLDTSCKTVDVDGQVCNHVNHITSSVKETTPADTASSQSTSAGMPC
ncbi:baculoviral IAP repeat-containing protein 6-like isoform X2 [Macrobrachium nipponense]|uniref:baculoviral IAP repeat-containing protein 6-like isoform X2 n=1 Tax=Macrobrachium nipponense TaxID=159736 RepID=UPI0030C89884